MFAFSCSKQSSPNIESEEVKGAREIERLNACSKVNFNKGVLLYQNVLSLFVCSKWDEEYPHMFQSIKTVSASSWDHLMAPIDQAFIENHQRRDRVFKNIRDLDSKGGLDDLSYVIVALNETNFFDSTKTLFTCVENSLDPACLSRLGRVPEKKSLKNIIKVVDANPETLENLSQFIKLFVIALNGQEENLRTEINKFRSSPNYIASRLKLVDAIADKARAGLTDEDRQFVSKILLTSAKGKDSPWIYQWLQDLKMTREKFRDLVEYPVLANPEFVGEIKNLEHAYDSGFSCTIKAANSPNDLLEFNVKTQLADYVSVIQTKGYKEFYDYSSSHVLGLKMSTDICRELENNQYNSNFIKTLTHFAEFVSEKKYYDLVKFLLNQTTAKGDTDRTFAENMYLLDVVTGDIFSSANAINSHITATTREFYPLVYDVVKTLPVDSYITMGELVKAVTNPENDLKFKGIADFWNFFTPEEKNFVFNFIDRHFDKQTDYVLLFDFYSKFLDDFREVQPIFRDKWLGDDNKEEVSYLTLQDLFSNFAGKETLLDFKKFFSRDQILKVLEIISNGQSINNAAKQELNYIYADNYVLRNKSEKYVFQVSAAQAIDEDYDSKNIIECMQRFSDIQNGFYDLVRNLPAACSKVTNENIAFRLYGWMNSIDTNYSKFKTSPSDKISLLDKDGILSPYMLNTTVGLTKVMDNLLGPLNSSVPTKNGVTYLLSSFNYYLNEKNAAPLIEKNLQWLNVVLDVNPGKNIQHRNALVKTFSGADNYYFSQSVMNNFGRLFSDYGDWIKSGEWTKAKNRSLGTYDPNQSCEKVINQFIAPYPCPSKEDVKLYTDDMLKVFSRKIGPNNESAIAMLLRSLKPDAGLDIPLDAKKTRKFRLSLRDTFRYLYDTSDKSLDINRVTMPFVNEYGKSSKEVVTTLERVESVIREVRFGNNYLGVAFVNAVVHAEDYNTEVAARKKLLSTCVKIPGVRCARKMSDNDLRMALNSLESYDALLDVNNGRGLSPKFQYGDYLRTFEQSLVGSSAIEAQKAQLLPLPDSALVKHNGKILSDMTVLTTWSNAARVIRDRIGRTREDFENFIKREDFKRVDRALLNGFDLNKAGPSANSLFETLTKKDYPNEKQTMMDNTIDWVASLNYDETRLLEDTLARLLVVGSYLGTPDVVFNKGIDSPLVQRYANNNLFQIFLALDRVITYWPTLKNYFPGDVKLIEAIKPINTALYFLTTKLNSSTDPLKNTTYLALNDLFLVLQKTLFDDVPNADIGLANTTQGLDLVVDMLKDPKLVGSTYSIFRDDYRYLDVFHQNNGSWFSTVGQNLTRLASSPNVNLGPVRAFLENTTRSKIRLAGASPDMPNYHYDEPASLVRYLNIKSDSKQSNFMLMNQKLFVENFDQITQMLDELLPAIKIKEVRPDLILN